MINIDFTENGTVKKTLSFPNDWEEMEARDVRFIFKEYERLASGKIGRLDFQLLVLYHFLGLGAPSKKAAEEPAIIENVSRLVKEMDFLFVGSESSQEAVPALSFRSVQNPLPRVKTAGRTLIGPATLCQDLTFGEFRNAALALNSFFQTEDPADLDECIANLYRPQCLRANSAGRKVKQVAADTFPADMKAVSGMPSWQKDLIMLWFASCIHFLQNERLTISGEEIDMKLLFTTGDESTSLQATWNDLLLQVARDGTLGTANEVDEAPLMFIILLMWGNYKENKRNERKLAKAKKA